MITEEWRNRFLSWLVPIHLDPEDHRMDKRIVINAAPTGAFISCPGSYPGATRKR